MFKEKYAAGKDLRSRLQRGYHASWKMPFDRPSVEEMIKISNNDRLPDLIPVRHYRMSKSPFVFYRATAAIMARDLSFTPVTGINVQACGDCHLMNFGGFATPERTMVVDMNDFDETHPGPWEWDIKRLATSFVLACRSQNLSDKDAQDVTMELLASYRDKLNEYAEMNFLELWYTKYTLQDLRKLSPSRKVQDRVTKAIRKSQEQSHDQVFYKITEGTLAMREISNQPPLIYHPFDIKESFLMIADFIDQYKSTLQPDRKLLVDQYKMVDVALKVVGVGSVGTRCYVVLMMNENQEPIFLQVKEARPSVLEAYTQPSKFTHQGERVVQGQRLIQAASDIFLGWATGPTGRHFYVRQLRDKKISFAVEEYDKFLLTLYARVCGDILARAHCKSAQGPLICGYIGQGDQFLDATGKFAIAYADQTEKDYEEFRSAIKEGSLEVKEDKEETAKKSGSAAKKASADQAISADGKRGPTDSLPVH